MFGKLIKLPFSPQFRGLSKPANCRYFAKHKEVVPKDEVSQTPTRTNITDNVDFTHELGKSVSGDVKRFPKLKDCAHLKYKKYPNVPHNDPNSPQYIHSERDEYADSVRIKSYNYVIDRLKSDIEMQAEIYQIIENLDRPYKRGTPGVHRNITGGVRDYFPPDDIGFTRYREKEDEKFFEEHYANEDRWENQTVFYPKFAPIKSDLEWQVEVENRPVNRHFHPEKGYKYDVEVPYEQRYPHVADRMGYPEILGTPWERLLRLEGEIYHPTYLDQPFVQIPTSDPHPSLNFEEGEVVYENTRILEWAKFLNYSIWSAYSFCAFFVPYSLLYKTHMPLPSSYEQIFVPYYNQTMFFWDQWSFHAVFIGGVAMYASQLVINLTHHFWKDYVVKMQYSKDKELLFVTRISPFGSTEEEVYETHHLEALPPSVKAGTVNLSSQDEDGLWDITCLASHKNLVLYNEDKYWNPSLKKDFFDKVMNLWTADVVAPSRLEEISNVANGPRVSIGAGGEQNVRKIEGAH